jgi:hypothetical protein
MSIIRGPWRHHVFFRINGKNGEDGSLRRIPGVAFRVP